MSNFLRGTNRQKFEEDVALLKVIGTITGFFIVRKIIKKRRNK